MGFTSFHNDKGLVDSWTDPFQIECATVDVLFEEIWSMISLSSIDIDYFPWFIDKLSRQIQLILAKLNVWINMNRVHIKVFK